MTAFQESEVMEAAIEKFPLPNMDKSRYVTCAEKWGGGFTTIDWVLRVFSTATRHCCPWEIESSENRMLSNGWNGADSLLETPLQYSCG